MNEDQKAFVDQLKYGQSFMLDGKRIDPKDIYMDKKPTALRLADELESEWVAPYEFDSASELRRLHQVNQELVEALENISLCSQNSMSSKTECGKIAQAALAKHKEQA